MALRNAVGGAYSAASVVNDGGTVVKGGNVASDSPMTKNLGLNTLADDFGTSFGSKVVAQADTGDKAGVAKAVSGGTLAYSAGATEWVMRGGNVSTTIGGVANDVLVSPARDTGDLNDFVTKANRLIVSSELVGASGYNVFAAPSSDIVPGRTRLSTAGDSFNFANPADGTDAVATEIAPSQAVPGELTYHFGSGAMPTTDEYKSKIVFES
jgi:hypothetical protein